MFSIKDYSCPQLSANKFTISSGGWNRFMVKKTFETALTKLEQITEELENGELSLEKSLEKFNEGMALVQFCSGKLDEAKSQVELLLKKDQTLMATPFAEEDRGDQDLSQ
jgi:exodeoxyribonuclease VII small subunit